jgi:hypothetical protein
VDLFWPGISHHQGVCLGREIGLTKLSDEVGEGVYRNLRELHDQLDEAVAAA